MTPEDAKLIEVGVEEALIDVHTSRLCTVVKVHLDGTKAKEVDIKIGKRMVDDGFGVLVEEDICDLTHIPIWRYAVGGFIVYLPVSVGDRGIVLFMEQSIGQYREGAKSELPDHIGAFDLSNGVFLPGFKINSEESSFTPQKNGLVIGVEGGAYLAVESDGTITAENSAGEFALSSAGQFSANGTNFTVDP